MHSHGERPWKWLPQCLEGRRYTRNVFNTTNAANEICFASNLAHRIQKMVASGARKTNRDPALGLLIPRS